MNTGCLFFDSLQEIWHMVGTIKFLCQCDDIPTLAECKIIPLIAFGIYLE